MSRSKILYISLEGMLSGLNAGVALSTFLADANIRAVVYQEHLSRAPELTQEAYKAAREAARNVGYGDFYLGLFSAGVAGLLGGFAMYGTCRKKE